MTAPHAQEQMKKTVILASPRGFCAGVDRAIKIVEVALEKYGRPVYVRHEIVHNKRVVNDLAAKGAVFVKELDEVPEGYPVIFSAHGVAKIVHQTARDLNMIAIDATCPLVTKVHIEASKHARNGRHILLIGHAGHPEVIGTMGQVDAEEITLIETVEEALAVQPPEDCELAFATQTTLSADETAEIITVLQHRFPEIRGPKGEDICYATTNRQNAVKEMAAEVDLCLVIGANNSSNSKRLVETALKAGVADALLVADAGDLPFDLIDNANVIGLTAGASAPEILTEEVLAALSERYQMTVTNQNFITEQMQFKLPSVLTK
ncbi:MAG TPA: 4-hydroxy-3-methylbut-2-enyl diphosphate reductase [Alphaproteobacteria bacterium]|nr:4-hydroxy-3-methylbut-2-enyl diphosphate reductase [Alphaproteobacteria bacterium]|tara:strand:+ start:1186 stop:2148 length:963 start_codon:yes stop_codon:yes gene_type:complete